MGSCACPVKKNLTSGGLLNCSLATSTSSTTWACYAKGKIAFVKQCSSSMKPSKLIPSLRLSIMLGE